MEKIKLRLSLTAIVISILSLLFSWFVYDRQDDLEAIEDANIVLTSYFEFTELVTKIELLINEQRRLAEEANEKGIVAFLELNKLIDSNYSYVEDSKKFIDKHGKNPLDAFENYSREEIRSLQGDLTLRIHMGKGVYNMIAKQNKTLVSLLEKQ
ncbi:hypothetical protein [Teredinibacter turnerae]|uniref:hypothetical protein n=1 Tax=Teredinibacter turnerae TaxID=2426 RepID=UPI0012FAAAB6|nr:hypothetical protein [Teredinibacter turnerae]